MQESWVLLPVIDENGNVGWFYWESGLPAGIHCMGIDRSTAGPDRCFLHMRPVFEDGTVGKTTTREITFGEMVAQQATLEFVKRRQGKR